MAVAIELSSIKPGNWMDVHVEGWVKPRIDFLVDNVHLRLISVGLRGAQLASALTYGEKLSYALIDLDEAAYLINASGQTPNDMYTNRTLLRAMCHDVQNFQ